MNSKKEWFLPKDLVDIEGLPSFPSNITRKAKQEGWIKREARGIKGGGFEFHYSSLPDKVQRALGFLEPVSEKIEKAIHSNSIDLQQRISQLEDKLQALESKANDFVFNQPGTLNEDEWLLVCAFRRCNEHNKMIAISTVEALATQTEKQQKENSKKSDSV